MINNLVPLLPILASFFVFVCASGLPEIILCVYILLVRHHPTMNWNFFLIFFYFAQYFFHLECCRGLRVWKFYSTVVDLSIEVVYILGN